MIPGFEKIVEERIRVAQQKGEFVRMKLNSLRGGRIAFEVPQHYEERLVRRFGNRGLQEPDAGHRDGK